MTTPDKPRRGQPPKPADQKADAQIQLRVTRARKAAYVSAANDAGLTLAAWMFDQCDRGAGKAGKKVE